MSSSSSKRPYSPVSPNVSLPQLEEEILRFWDENQVFEKSVNSAAPTSGAGGESRSKKSFSFYDGPPFATGLPHYGHLLAGTLKDIVPRYWTMKGYSVARRFGWDCHGLPVEYEINKSLGIQSNKDVYAMGVDKYNAACRSIVQRYSQEWKRTVKRIGRWVDMENAYFTMDVSFMESVWWVFQQMWKKGLIYEGHKVVPYSTGLSTPLSNFEANLNYKQVQDPAITVNFPVIGEKDTYLLAWTTTPWTLPSNLGLAVHRDVSYVKLREKATGKQYYAAEALWRGVFGKNPQDKAVDANFEVVETLLGAKLLGKKYEPIFPFFADLDQPKDGKAALRQEGQLQPAFQVIHSDHVTTDAGVGIVHMAPAFGEEDYYACKAANLPFVNPVDDDGMFTAQVGPYAGKRVKDADKDLIADIKSRGRLVKHDTIMHSYPYCWRTDTPLIYRAVSSWFVAVEKIKEPLIQANLKTRWVPEHLREGRFGKWLENARDWAISRNRFWGTPLPVWRNEEGEVLCVGSREELEKLSGKKVDDLHIEVVNQITIPSPTGKSPLKRIEPVLDCWFESGSMPYAQWGYPKTHAEEFKKNFPADFIAEGLDQTRGWFYTLTVVGTALFGESPFKNVVVNGLILAEDGKKMSKSLKNYPDPNEVLDKHGADALRLYLIDSPVVKAEELRFSEKGVTDVVRKILLRWWNSYAFFVNYANVDGFTPRFSATPNGVRGDFEKSENILDRWILSRLHSLIQNTEKEMEAYRLYNVVPQLLQFIEDLTNTYIRFNRSHFWQNGMPEDKRLAYETLYEVLTSLSRVMAPFAPFLAETIYRNLAQVLPATEPARAAGSERVLSVHLTEFPHADAKFIRPELEEAVKVMDALVQLGRNHRETIKVKAKIPLLSMKIIHREKRVLENLKKFQPYFQDELNIRDIQYVSDEDQYVQVTAKANFPVLGKRVGPKMKAIAAQIQALPLAQLLKLEAGESIVIDGETITFADMEIRRAPKGNNPNLATHQLVSIEVDPTVREDQISEGLSREVMRKIQQARKNANLQLDQHISLELSCSPALRSAAEAHMATLKSETLCQSLNFSAEPKGQFTEEAEVELDSGTEKIKIGLTPVK